MFKQCCFFELKKKIYLICKHVQSGSISNQSLERGPWKVACSQLKSLDHKTTLHLYQPYPIPLSVLFNLHVTYKSSVFFSWWKFPSNVPTKTKTDQDVTAPSHLASDPRNTFRGSANWAILPLTHTCMLYWPIAPGHSASLNNNLHEQ
jgi:hypothetical protein